MRRTCEWADYVTGGGTTCEQLAVDFVERAEINWWLCAHHFDIIMRARAAFSRIKKEFKSEYGY